MSITGLVVKSGRILKARMLAGEVSGGLTWCAIGQGNWADILNPPAEVDSQVTLTNEYARKRVTRFAYLQIDDALGTIPWSGHLYAEVPGPTPIVAFFTTFTEDEAVGALITELGIFGGQVITLASPYATVAQVVVPGTLYWCQNRPVFAKTSRDTYQIICVFEEK